MRRQIKKYQFLSVVKNKEFQNKVEEFQIKIGKRIKEIRLSKGLTQSAVAHECAFTRQMISKIETGQVNLSLSSLIKLSEVLETTSSDLLNV